MNNKLQLMQVAATLTAGVVGNLPDDLVLDPTISADKVKAENLMAWEIFRIFYHGVLGAFADETSWPSPKSALSQLPTA